MLSITLNTTLTFDSSYSLTTTSTRPQFAVTRFVASFVISCVATSVASCKCARVRL